MRFVAALALVACAACGGGPRTAPEAARPAWSPQLEQEWYEKVARIPEPEIDLIEALAVLSCPMGTRPLKAEDIRRSLAPALEEARNRFASAGDVEARIRIVNDTILRQSEKGLDGDLRSLREVLSARDGDCLVLSALYLESARTLGLSLEAVSLPGHFFVRHSAGGRVRNIETTDHGLAATNPQYVEKLSGMPGFKESFPESSEHLEKVFSPVTRRQFAAALLCQRAGERVSRGLKRSALDDYQKAIRLTPEWHLPYALMALCQAETLEDHEKAEAFISQAIERAPYLPQQYHNRGVCREKRGNLKGALEDMETARRMAPSNAQFAYAHGNVYRVMENYREAINCFTRALELKPGFEDALSNRAQVLLYFTNDPEKAISDFTLLIERHPTQASYWHNRGVCHVKLRQYPQGLADLSRAIVLEPKNGSIRRDRASILANSKKLPEALADLDEAVRLNPKDAKAYAMRARVHQLMGEPEKARLDQERAGSAHQDR